MMRFGHILAATVFCMFVSAAHSQTIIVGNCSGNSVGGHNNKQTNTCVTYNLAPNPAFHVLSSSDPIKNADGTYLEKIVVHLDVVSPPGNMAVVAHGDSVRDLWIRCLQCFMHLDSRGTTKSPGRFAFTTMPFGDYEIDVTVSDFMQPTNIVVGFNVQPPPLPQPTR